MGVSSPSSPNPHLLRKAGKRMQLLMYGTSSGKSLRIERSPPSHRHLKKYLQ